MINIIYCRNAHVSTAPDFAAPGASFSALLEPMASPSLIYVLDVHAHTDTHTHTLSFVFKEAMFA
jgi:hypothetical protein